MKKLIRLLIELRTNELETTEVEWECEEKKKIFQLSRVDKYGEKTTRHLNKEELFSPTRNGFNVTLISFSIMTPPERLEEARELLMKKIKEDLEFNIKAVDGMKKVFGL